MRGTDMIVVPPERYVTVMALYGETLSFALIRAVLERSQPGVVFADRTDDPQWAFVITRFGFAQAFGAVEDDALMAALSSDAHLTGRYLLWYAPPARCRAAMDVMPDEKARARTRIRFHWDAAQFDTNALMTPAGAQLAEINERILPLLEPLKLEIGGRFWPTTDAFLEHGFGSAIMVDERVASVCYAACVAGGVAEVDVATVEDYRGRGLARCAAEAFVKQCQARGVAPNWDCFDTNTASVRLAARLGFVEAGRYPFYSINT